MSRIQTQTLRMVGAGTLVFLTAAFINSSSCSATGLCTTIFGGISYLLVPALIFGLLVLVIYGLQHGLYVYWLRFAVPWTLASMGTVVLFWDYRLLVTGVFTAFFFLGSSVIIRRSMGY